MHAAFPRVVATIMLLMMVPVVVAADRQPAATTKPASGGIEFFEKRIRPVLIKHCYKCHSGRARKLEGKLRLDSRDFIRKGGETGPAVVPGKPGTSLLLKAIRYESLEMPPSGKLSARVIADFQAWIQLGAPDPRDEATTRSSRSQPGMTLASGRRWWSFQPVKQQSLPETSRNNWARHRLDHFVLSQLEKHRLDPSPPADRRTLIRRITLDLIGLPPTTAEIDRFTADKRPTAIRQLVDRLLASRHYGERWGRHWLDVARWAEDNPTSEATNRPHPDAWRYRDWVIQAFNSDLPYDRFIKLQLAADLMPGFRRDDLRALGYLGTAPTYHKDPRLSKTVIETIATDDWDERVDAVSRGLLGLTVSCARCHAHKFDAVTQEDYYALAGVFASNWKVKRPLVELTAVQERQVIWAQDRIWRLKVAIALKKDPATPSTPEEIAAMEAEVAALEQTPFLDAPSMHAVYDAAVYIDGSDPEFTWMDFRIGEPRDLPVFLRGNVATPGKIVPRRFLEVLSPGPPRLFKNGSGRLELAEQIVTNASALAARIIVNRAWGWHFGRPLVTTTSNFGVQGEKPTHPRLLDDLAAAFIANGWSLKWLHREILLSATYAQSSRHRPESAKADPVNRWLWRFARRRVDFETWRDSILAVTGSLDTRPFGPSQSVDDPKNVRRTVYATVSRRQVSPLMRLYDFPDVAQHVPGRDVTTTPLQQLFVFNSEFFIQQARALASRTDASDRDDSQNISGVYQRVFARKPSGKEQSIGRAFLNARRKTHPRTAWADYCQALLATSELIFVD